MRYLPTLDLSMFDAIDLDAYGWPCDQLAVVARRAPEATAVFVTRGQMAAFKAIPASILAAAGIPPEWIDWACGAVTQNGEALWDSFVASLGYRWTRRYVATGGATMFYEQLFRERPR